MTASARPTRRRTRLRSAAVSALLAAVTAAPACAGMVTAPAGAATRLHISPARSAATAWHAAYVASRQRGKKYVYGGAGPTVFDCSGLVQYSYRLSGVRIPRTAQQQYRASRHIPLHALRPGDVVFFHDRRGHVYHDAIYAGYGAVWNAPHTGTRVRLQRVWTSAIWFGRFV